MKHFFMVFCMLCIACQKKPQAGHYGGSLTRSVAAHFSEEVVGFEIEYTKDNEATVQIEKADHTPLGRAILRVTGEHSIHLRLESLVDIPTGGYSLSEKAVKSQIEQFRCFADADPYKVKLCFNDIHFNIILLNDSYQMIAELHGSTLEQIEPLVLEEPQNITLTEAIDTAFKSSFDAKISLIQITDASNAANAAWLNLLPHITTNLIWNAAPGFIPAIATLEALAPFLLPSYWMEAVNADIYAKMARYGWLIAQADIATNVEQLCYAYVRDRNIKEKGKKVLDVLHVFEEKIMEKKDELGADRAAALLAIKKYLYHFIDVEVAIGEFDQALELDRYAISRALGKTNPEAVSDVTIDEERELYINALPLENQLFSSNALLVSFEIQQLKFLREISKIKRVQLFFYWVDPSSYQTMSLGANLFPQEKIATSQIDQLALKEQEMIKQIYQDSFKLVLQYNYALDHAKKMPEPEDFDTQLVEFADFLALELAGANQGTDFFKEWLQKHLGAALNHETNLSLYRMARARKDRVQLTGFYHRIFSDLHDLKRD